MCILYTGITYWICYCAFLLLHSIVCRYTRKRTLPVHIYHHTQPERRRDTCKHTSSFTLTYTHVHNTIKYHHHTYKWTHVLYVTMCLSQWRIHTYTIRDNTHILTQRPNYSIIVLSLNATKTLTTKTHSSMFWIMQPQNKHASVAHPATVPTIPATN